MAILTVPESGNLDIQQLQEIVRSKEMTVGRLCTIGLTDNGDLRLTFNVIDGADDIVPAGKSTSIQIVNGHPENRPGFTLVCFGPIFVEGELKSVAAYRPN